MTAFSNWRSFAFIRRGNGFNDPGLPPPLTGEGRIGIEAMLHTNIP